MVSQYPKVFMSMSGEVTGTYSLSNADYHAHPAVSKSHLDKVAKSPAHYWEAYLNPDRSPQEPTAAMVLGTALHTAVLEPHLWAEQFAVPPHAFDRRTKAGKELAAAFEAEAEGKVVLTPDDADRVQLMAKAVHDHPASRFLLNLEGKREHSYFWNDADTGIDCKCRPDWHSLDRRLVVDIKTTEDASPAGFAKSVAKFRYHVQSHWYLRALEGEQFLFVCVEKTAPYLVAVYVATPALVAAGGRTAEKNLAQIAECRAADQWPGYGDEIQPIDLPSWCHD